LAGLAFLFESAVSEKHNAAKPNILAGGTVYQNWALKSPAPLRQQGACQVLIADPYPLLLTADHETSPERKVLSANGQLISEKNRRL
jgi:hypothetical protein